MDPVSPLIQWHSVLFYDPLSGGSLSSLSTIFTNRNLPSSSRSVSPPSRLVLTRVATAAVSFYTACNRLVFLSPFYTPRHFSNFAKKEEEEEERQGEIEFYCRTAVERECNCASRPIIVPREIPRLPRVFKGFVFVFFFFFFLLESRRKRIGFLGKVAKIWNSFSQVSQVSFLYSNFTSLSVETWKESWKSRWIEIHHGTKINWERWKRCVFNNGSQNRWKSIFE